MNNLCPSCKAVYNVTAKNIGRRVLCTKCRVPLVVTERGLECVATKPAPAPAPAQAVPWHQGMAPPQPAHAARQDNDADDGGDDDRDDSEVRRKPRWSYPFGSGCGLVKWGMWVNFAGFAYLILLFEASLLGLSANSKGLILIDKLGFYAPLYLFEIAGSVMMLTGWWRMTQVPSNSGAAGLMTGASILAGLRTLTLFVGTVYLIMAVAAKGLDGLRYLVHSYSAFMLAEACLLVATFSAVPGMAIIGGEIPNRRLRQQAGWVTLIHQILAISLLSLFAAGIYLAWMSDFLGDMSFGEGAGESIRTRPSRTFDERPVRSKPTDPIPIVMFFLLAILAIQGAYTYLHASLYETGRKAAARGPDPH